MLQDLIEKVMVLRKAVEREKRQVAGVSNSYLAEQLRLVSLSDLPVGLGLFRL